MKLCMALLARHVSGILCRARWRWLGHVLRMGPARLPLRLLRYDPAALGFVRPPHGVRLSWCRLMLNDAWKALPEGRRFWDWRRWQAGGWLDLLRGRAANRLGSRSLTDTVVLLAPQDRSG